MQCVICLRNDVPVNGPQKVVVYQGYSLCEMHLKEDINKEPFTGVDEAYQYESDCYESDPYSDGGGPGSWEAGRVDY